jgi:hypothetical protein
VLCEPGWVLTFVKKIKIKIKNQCKHACRPTVLSLAVQRAYSNGSMPSNAVFDGKVGRVLTTVLRHGVVIIGNPIHHPTPAVPTKLHCKKKTKKNNQISNFMEKMKMWR